MSHSLHARPTCRPEDLGTPIPGSPHSVSVCLPAWDDIIGYEEKNPRVIDKLRTGYPRFFLHPLVKELRRRLCPAPGEDVLPFPDEESARECAAHAAGRVKNVQAGLWAAYFPGSNVAHARAYWQHTGRILSSRAAEDWLGSGKLATPDEALESCMRARLAGWIGVEPGLVTLHASGMAAIYAAFCTVAARRPGCRTAMFGFPYTDTLKVLERFGCGAEFYPQGDATDLLALRTLLEGEEIAGIFCEVPSNPLLRTPDLPALHELASAHGVPLVVDDTIGTCVNVDALAYADLVATSLTKAVSGEGDVMAGALAANPRGLFPDGIPQAHGAIYARDLAVLEMNSRDFPDRVHAANAQGLELARFLSAHPAVERVWYPGLGPDKNYDRIRKSGGGYGAVLSFLPKDAEKSAPRIFEKLAISRGISLGTPYSLVCPYVQLAHYHELDWVRACGIDPYLLRVAVGTETDLETRFSAALG